DGAIARARLGGRALEGVALAARQDHAVAILEKRQRRRLADAAPRAGDDRDFTVHGHRLPRGRLPCHRHATRLCFTPGMWNRTAGLCLLAACGAPAPSAPTVPTVPAQPSPPPDRSVVIVVWDGLRPEAVDAAETPNLARLRDAGVDFTD